MFNEINKGNKSSAALINLAHSLERADKSSALSHIHLEKPSLNTGKKYNSIKISDTGC